MCVIFHLIVNIHVTHHFMYCFYYINKHVDILVLDINNVLNRCNIYTEVANYRLNPLTIHFIIIYLSVTDRTVSVYSMNLLWLSVTDS